VEGGHQLRQRRHLDALGDEGADAAADHDAREDGAVAEHARCTDAISVVTTAITMPAMP